MPRKKSTEQTPPVEEMFKDLEKDVETSAGPEGANQKHLGGDVQKLDPIKEIAKLDGSKKPVTDLSEGESEVNANFGKEMDFHLVTLHPKNLQYIPGLKKNRLHVLRDWCSEYCDGGWKPMSNGLTWMFENEKDSEKFDKAWNSRALIEQEKDVTDGAFYE